MAQNKHLNTLKNQSKTNQLRELPSIEEVLEHPDMKALVPTLPRQFLVDSARKAVDQARNAILSNNEDMCQSISLDKIAYRAACLALSLQKPSMRRVINASGVVIHTNLGRSVLAKEAVNAVNETIRGYCTLEYNTETLSRGSRHDHCEQLICALTGAEAAIAVNNNAAAVMLVLSEFANGHDALVSRGELVEIGGSFRVPDIMALSHANMIEVGTTNKTHISDYQRALTPNCTMLLKVHPSNYRMIGFTESVSLSEMRTIANAENKHRDEREGGTFSERVLVYEDQGSGAFLHMDCFANYAEPTVAQSLKCGADLVSFSGDKLLGGPQAGIIVGTKELIDRLKSNPLARVVRLDKMTIAALEATLRLYLDPEQAKEKIPTVSMLTIDEKTVESKANNLKTMLAKKIPVKKASFTVESDIARAGGGALPMCDIPSFVVKVEFTCGNAQDCEKYLVSRNNVAIVARIKHNALLFDARTILPGEEEEIVNGIANYFEFFDRHNTSK